MTEMTQCIFSDQNEIKPEVKSRRETDKSKKDVKIKHILEHIFPEGSDDLILLICQCHPQ